jgi:hypothetical protein
VSPHGHDRRRRPRAHIPAASSRTPAEESDSWIGGPGGSPRPGRPRTRRIRASVRRVGWHRPVRCRKAPSTGYGVYCRHDRDGVAAGLRRSGGRGPLARRPRAGSRWPGRAWELRARRRGVRWRRRRRRALALAETALTGRRRQRREGGARRWHRRRRCRSGGSRCRGMLSPAGTGSWQRTRWYADARQPAVQGRSFPGFNTAQMCVIRSPATANAYTATVTPSCCATRPGRPLTVRSRILTLPGARPARPAR